MGTHTTAGMETRMPMALSAEQRMAILKAIGDPRRMEIVERLSASQNCTACTCLRETLPISAATLSHHIKELETAGLIEIERHGKFADLTLRRDVWEAFLASLRTI